MKPKIFFQASMPRSGSTLFQNIMHQNHQFYATPTSGLSLIVKDLINSFSNTIEFRNDYYYAPILKPYSFTRFCRDGIYGWYATLTKKPYILDKSRAWLHDVPFLNLLFPSPRIIILVRDLRDVLASYEKMYLNDYTQKYFSFTDETRLNNILVDDRFDFYLKETNLNLFLKHLYNIIYSPYYKELYILKYEDLISNPENKLKEIYKYLNLPYYEKHQFNNIVQHTRENDNYNRFGDHSIRKVLKLPSSNSSSLIPEHINNKIYTDYEWFFKEFNYKK